MNYKTAVMRYFTNQAFCTLAGCFKAVFLIISTSGAVAQSAQIIHQPAEVTITEGETFEVVVEVHAGSQHISVADVRMQYDTGLLEVLEVSTPEGGLEANSIAPAFSNSEGTISMGSFQLSGEMPSGVMEVLHITFLAIAPIPITSIVHPSDVFPRSILAYAGVDHLGNVGPLDITILPSIVLSDGDEELQNDDLSLEIWPNPTSDQVNVIFRTTQNGQVQLELYDVTGKMVTGIYNGSAMPGAEHRFNLDVSALNTGLYFCRLISSSDGILVKRLVVGQ